MMIVHVCRKDLTKHNKMLLRGLLESADLSDYCMHTEIKQKAENKAQCVAISPTLMLTLALP